MIAKRRLLLELTTKLADIPREWLRYIEPRIVRPKDSTCWLWDGACDADGEPVLNYKNLVTGKRNTRRLKVIIAEIFWEMKKHFDVIHECGTTNCLNPWHFYISVAHHSQEDRRSKIAAKQRSIKDYVARKPR